MALREIRVQGDPVLAKVCKEVKEVTPRTMDLIDDMIETMYEANGVGLAAPQVGILKRIVVIDVGEGPIVMINPTIVATDGEQTGDEGCLSVPGKAGIVTRPNYVKARFFDEEMNECEVEGTELLARAICHELDHLDGHLYVEKVEGELYDVNYEEEDLAEIDIKYENEEFVIFKWHYKTADDVWGCDGYTYKYRLEISGKLPNSAKNTTYIVLSNTTDITFKQTWMASGFSSNMADYFDPAVAVIVGQKIFS